MMQVALFIPCIADNLFPSIGQAIEHVLERLGIGFSYPPAQTCCGQPAFNAGYHEEAKKLAGHFLRTFAKAEAVVCPSGSCVSMVRNYYPALFADRPEELELARSVGSITYELTEFLVKVIGVTDIGATFKAKATYHHSCHLNRELGIANEPLRLLREVRGLEITEMADADRCCGFGGTFSVKMPEVSAAMARRKAELISKTGADIVVACDPGCIMQIKGYLSRANNKTRVMHIAEVLAEDKA